MSALRVAFIGASGTGKSTLAVHLSESHGLPLNPVGSRSVAKAMGFESPYDVDKVGRRAEFQRRLLTEKVEWEGARDSFVSDRTVVDNLVYTVLHDVRAVDEQMLDLVLAAMKRYTHIVYCPVKTFCNVAGDPSRVKDASYHLVYDVVATAFVKRFFYPHSIFINMDFSSDLTERIVGLDRLILDHSLARAISDVET